MGEAVEIVKALVSPAEKLIDNISKGIGVVYQPKHVRKMAEAKAYEIKSICDAIQGTVDLPVVYEDGVVSMDSSDVAGLIQRANHRQALQAARKQQNIESIVGKAYALLESNSPVEDDPIEEDWLNRFFDAAENVSSEDMQLIWARILAGETQNPGKFSVRTLELVKNLSKEEATVFQKILPLTILAGGGRAIVSDEEILKKYGVTYGDVLVLDDCGMINSSTAVIPKKIQKGETASYLAPARLMHIMCNGDKEVDVSLSIYKLTKPAVELLEILSYEHNEEYFCDIAESIFKKRNQQGIVINVHIIESWTGEACNYRRIPVREFK